MFPHHHRLQHVNKCTVAPPLFQKGSPHSLLLCLLHQQIQVADVLHGAVQLGAQVPTACVTRESRRRRTGHGGAEIQERNVERRGGMLYN